MCKEGDMHGVARGRSYVHLQALLQRVKPWQCKAMGGI